MVLGLVPKYLIRNVVGFGTLVIRDHRLKIRRGGIGNARNASKVGNILA
jgi:hypothetical protein